MEQGAGSRRRLITKGMAALVALSLVAAACGSDDDKATSTTAAATATTAAGTATTAGASETTVAGGATTDAPTPETTGGGSSDDALIIARGMDVNSLNPSLAYCDTCQIFLTAVYETLIGLDDDNKTQVPRLATDWEGNDDQTEFSFTLDPNAKFADGNAVTSSDVKFSWERLAGLQGGASYLASGIKSIDDSDPGVVKVTLKASNSAFLAQVNAPYLGIMEKSVAEANGATLDPNTDKAEEWFLSNSAGSGPFSLDSYALGDSLVLNRNDSYWGTPANFPQVVIKETPQAVTQRQQLEEGAVDIAMQLSADVADGLSNPDVTVEKVPSFNYVYLALSPGAKGAEQLTPEVREAIRLALDYTGLIDVTVGGAGLPQASPIPNGFAGTDGLPTPTQDLDKAKELMASAGVSSLTLDATYPQLNVYGVDFSTAMQKVQTDLQEIGIELELNPVEISVWADKINADGIPVTMLYFAPDHTDSSQYVQYFGLITDSAWLDRSGAEINPEEETLLAKALATQDPDERAAIYNQLGTAMINDQIIIPVVNPELFLASRANITGMHYSACCNLNLAKLGKS